MTPQQQDEQNQIRLYEIMRGELDTPYVAEASLDNHAPDYWGGCSGEVSIPLNASTPLYTLSAIQIEGEEAGWFDTSFTHPAQPINNQLNIQEVKKQNGNT
jgi:hypothetical protein